MIGFGYGALCDSLEEQAKEKGYILNNSEKYENIRSSILTLTFARILTDKQIDTCYQKLHKQVVKALTPIE